MKAFLIVLFSMLISQAGQQVYANTCFEYEKYSIEALTVEMEGNSFIYEEMSIVLPLLGANNVNSCFVNLQNFVREQGIVKHLARSLVTLREHGLSEYQILQHANALALNIDGEFEQQRLFLYALAQNLGYKVAFSYNQYDKNDTAVWFANSQQLAFIESVKWEDDYVTYHPIFDQQVDANTYEYAHRQIKKGQTLDLPSHQFCFAQQEVITGEVTTELLGTQTTIPSFKIRLPELTDRTFSRCLQEALDSVITDQNFKKLSNQFLALYGFNFNDWRIVLEADAYVEQLPLSKSSREFLLFALTQAFGLQTAFSFNAKNENMSAVWFSTQQKFHISGIVFEKVPNEKFYALLNKNLPDGAYKHAKRPRGQDGKILDVFNGAISFVNSLNPRIKNVDIQFVYRGAQDSVKLQYNSLLSEYWSTLPSMTATDNRNLPALTAVDSILSASIEDAFLNESICEKGEINCHKELLERLLAFTGSGFEYATDTEVHGHEWHMPLSVLLHHNELPSDCDDRALAFVTIAKLLGYESAIINLPNHLAAGVKLEVGIEGAKIIEGYHYAEATATDGYAKLGEHFDAPYVEDVLTIY